MSLLLFETAIFVVFSIPLRCSAQEPDYMIYLVIHYPLTPNYTFFWFLGPIFPVLSSPT